jgi:mono/diheme cytochrome c family protein
MSARTLSAALASLILAGCGSARRGEPLHPEQPRPSEKIAMGEQLFDKNCSQCHPGGEAGLGPALNNKPLPQFAVHFQVRHGVGAMPAFSKRDLTDEQVSAVTSYMVWLRKQKH